MKPPLVASLSLLREVDSSSCPISTTRLLVNSSPILPVDFGFGFSNLGLLGSGIPVSSEVPEVW